MSVGFGAESGSQFGGNPIWRCGQVVPLLGPFGGLWRDNHSWRPLLAWVLGKATVGALPLELSLFLLPPWVVPSLAGPVWGTLHSSHLKSGST